MHRAEPTASGQPSSAEELEKELEAAREEIARLRSALAAPSSSEAGISWERLARTLPAAVVLIGPEGRLRFANEAAEKVLGMKLEEIEGRPYDDAEWQITSLEGELIPRESRPTPLLLAGKEVKNVQMAVMRPSGERVLLTVNGTPFRDDGGELEGGILVLEDVTEEVAIREELARYQRHLETIVESRTSELIEANERLQQEAKELEIAERRQRVLVTAIEAVREGVAITDLEVEAERGPRLLFVNDFLCELSGYPPRHLAGERLGALLAPGENRQAIEELRSAVLEGKSFQGEFRYRHRSGEELLVSNHFSPVVNNAGELTHLISIQKDVTQEKEAERALRESEERYRLLIEQMNEGFVATDRDNQVILTNPRLEEMLGYAGDELVGRYMGDFTDEANRHLLEAQEAKRHEGLAESYELTWQHKDGTGIDTNVSPTSIQDAEGEFAGSFAVVTDITERKRMEEESRRLEARIQKAQKMESLGLLAGGVAHDFNNLLVGMLGHAGLALMELPPQSSARGLIRQIEIAALRASELTKEMLAYSGKGKFLVEAIDLSALVEEMAHLLKVTISKKAVINFNFAPDLSAVEGDPTQIRQIVMNLITNASEAIGDRSGVITITTGEMYADREYLSATYMDDELDDWSYVYLEVADTGSGMDEETRAKIFDPFFTTKFTGRGLGLAAVLGIVRGHRGAIKVYSEPRRGTSFKILFPAISENARVAPQEETVDELKIRASGRVLVADDEEMVRGVAKLSLETVGYTVVTASDGQEAVETFRREEGRFDVVLLDLTMPRMGGEEAYREIRRIRADTKVVLSSGFNELDTVQRFPGRGLAGFLQKPFKPQELIKTIREILE